MKRMMHAESLSGTKASLLCLLLLLTMSTKAFSQIADKRTYLSDVLVEMHKQWPNNRTQNLVFHGHSVPTGYYTSRIGVRTFDSYPFYTLKSLKDRYPYCVLNCIVTSIGGENSQAGSRRFTKTVLNHRPDVLFIDYSLNDRRLSLEEARSNWSRMIRKALARGIKVILLTPTPDLKEDIRDPETLLARHAQMVRSLAETYHVGLVDSYSIFRQMALDGVDLKHYMSQNNHPNEKGHRVVADAILEWFLDADNYEK